jgi:hypothetical protein
MKKRTDEEIQEFLDQGGDAANASGWESDDLLDLRAYALIGEVLSEEPDFALPADFANVMADRLMPVIVTPAERFGFGALLAAFSLAGAAVAVGALPLAVGGASRIAAAVAEYGRADVVLAVAAVLPAIALLDRLLPLVWQRAARARATRYSS